MAKAKKLEKSKIVAQELHRKATIDRQNINEDERRVAIAISTEEPIRVRDYWSDLEYDEVLLHGEENVDLVRAKTAKLKWLHGRGKNGDLPIGKLENVRLEDKKLKADAVFSKANPDAEMFWQMVLEGTLSEISVGARKKEVRVTERSGDVPLVEIIKWEFLEASLVDIGADPNAGVNRSLEKGDYMNKVEELRRRLAELEGKGGDNSNEIAEIQRQIDNELKKLEDENKELKRRQTLSDIARAYNMPEDELKPFLNDKTKTEQDLMRALLDKKTKEDVSVGVVMPGSSNRDDNLKRAVADAMILRAGVSLANPHQDANMFRSASFADIIRSITGYTGFDKLEMVKRAMSTSDFPVLLGNVANRVLVTNFEEAEGTYDKWTASTEVPDFKTRTEASRSRLAGRLKKLTEYGETKKSESKESAESWRLYSYGDSIKLSREMIINDDLNAFTDLIKEYAAMAKRTANGLVYDLLQGKGEFESYKMADGKAIFDTAHENYDASGAALVTDSLSSARTKMRRQKDAAKVALNITPKYLLVAPELETKAYQLLNSEADVGASQSGVANPFRNSLTPIIEAELDANPWYLAANSRTIKVGYLAGTGGKPTIGEADRNSRFIEYECVFDFGLFAEDYRGLYKNAGA